MPNQANFFTGAYVQIQAFKNIFSMC